MKDARAGGVMPARRFLQPQVNMNLTLEPILTKRARFEKTAPQTIGVAVVDADPAVRAALAELLAAEDSCRLLLSCADSRSALDDLPGLHPEVILLDVNLPGEDGVDCVRQLKARLPVTHIIVYTACEEPDRLLKVLIAGASGYLLKRTPSARLLTAIREVCEGGAPMSPEIARYVLQQLRQYSGAPAEKVNLTPRELEILDQLSKGFRYKEIVDNLGISFGTLHSYISKVYEKLQVHSRTEAVVKYLNL